MPPSDPSSTTSDEPAAGSTAIRVRIGDTVLTARLRDVPASRDLVAQLPLTLTFRDFNAVEKISRLPWELSMDGVPVGDDPASRDIGYYAPSGDVVFHYGDVGHFPEIVRLGQLDGSVDAIESQTVEDEPADPSPRAQWPCLRTVSGVVATYVSAGRELVAHLNARPLAPSLTDIHNADVDKQR